MPDIENPYQEVFENAPVALMIEDFSRVKSYFNGLSARGVMDLGRYMEDHQEEVFHCASLAEIVDVNTATLELLGAESKEVLHRSLEQVFCAESWSGFQDNLVALARGELSNEVQTVNRRLTGEKIHVVLRWTVAAGSRETLSRVFVSLLDITRRVNAEARFRDLCGHLPEPIFEADTSTVITFANQRALDAFGYTHEELESGLTLLDMIAPSDHVRARDNLASIFNGSASEANEYVARRKDGGTFPVLIHTRRVVDEAGVVVGVRGVAVDITERKRVEEERERLIAEIQGALAKIKTLKGLIPICASCKNIRDDEGYWHHVEAYIGEHSDAEFTHGLCPECSKRLYPKKGDPGQEA